MSCSIYSLYPCCLYLCIRIWNFIQFMLVHQLQLVLHEPWGLLMAGLLQVMLLALPLWHGYLMLPLCNTRNRTKNW